MKYTVTMKVKGEIEVEVEANSFDEAFKLSYAAFEDIDLNQLVYIDADPCNATDESGEIHYVND